MPNTPDVRSSRTKKAEVAMASETTAALGTVARPTADELDERDRRKSGPRRQAGPRLAGPEPESGPVRALSSEELVDPTEPEEG